MNKDLALIIFPCLALMGGGGSNPWWTGLFILLNGLWVGWTGFPFRIPKVTIFWWAALLWGGLSWMTGFLIPLNSWRDALARTGLGSSLFWTPQPLLSLESFLLFTAGLLWLTWLLADPVGERTRLRSMRILGIGIGALGIIALICKIQKWPLPFLDDTEYGFFPNRNHMSNWLAMGGMAAAGSALADARRRQWLWTGLSALSIAGIMLCLSANTSRGGLSIFFIGLLVWSVALSWRGPDRRVGAAMLALVILGATTLLFTGGKSLDRFKSPEKIPPVRAALEDTSTPSSPSSNETASNLSEGPSLDFRLQIFLDTLGLVKATPLLGTGPGNFSYLFPPFRDRTLGVQSRALHPESDVLWFAAEYGLPALLLGMIGTLALFRLAAPGHNREGWVTRSAAAAAVLAFLLHGIVDVPAHRIGTIWLAMTLAGFAFGRKSEAGTPPPAWQPLTLRILSFGVAGAGLLWFCGLVFHQPWPVSVAADRAQTEIVSGWRAMEVEKSLALSERALTWMPLEENLHFLRGKNLLFFEKSEEEAAGEFRLQSRLEPYRISVLIDQASAWAEWYPEDPSRALETLQAALDLAEKLPADSDRIPRVLNGISQVCRINPALRLGATNLLEKRPELLALWLSQAKAEEFLPTLAVLRASDPDLKNFPDKSKTLLFMAWYRWGDRSELLQEMQSHPDWGPSAWPLHSQLLAKEKRFQEAIEHVRQFIEPPTLPDRETTKEEAERRWYRSPRDFGAAFALAEFRREASDLSGVRVVLEKITQRPDVPAYFWWLRSNLEAQENRWEPAWESLSNYLKNTVKNWPKT